MLTTSKALTSRIISSGAVNNFRSIKSPLANGLPLGSLYTLVAMVAVTVKSIEQFPKSGLGVRHDQKGNDLKTNVRKPF